VWHTEGSRVPRTVRPSRKATQTHFFVVTFMAFMPEPSAGSIGAYDPERSDVRKELTSEILSVLLMASGSSRKI
jgi:hypothetical protein